MVLEEKGKVKPIALTKLELFKKYSKDYQVTKRAIGPNSWFYEFMTPEGWNNYEEYIQTKYKELENE